MVLKLLIMEDDPDQQNLLKLMLSAEDREIRILKSGNKVIGQIRDFKPHIVISDIMMPGMTGSNVYQAIREKIGPDLPILISSGAKLKIKIKDDPLVDFCPKPVDFEDMEQKMKDLLEKAGEN